MVRDTEWLVRRKSRTSNGGDALFCVGLSEIVRDREAVFLTDVEERHGGIQILDPAETNLVPDTSNEYRASLLYLESMLRQTPPTDENLYIGHKAAMDLVPYQLDPAVQALSKPRQRILIADSVGLGKTLEAGILLSELIRRGRGRRILVVTMKSMLTQFQKELWARFSLPLTRLDSIGLQRVRSRIPGNHNPFYYYDKSIISIDTLKQDNEFRVHLENARWDVIVIDEAQNVAERGHGRTQRARLARLLSGCSDSLIMLSATPHDGRARSFASLMNMLDPTAIADPDNYGPEDIKGMFIRRFKKDIQHQVRGAFQERKISTTRTRATLEEESAFDALLNIRLSRPDHKKNGGILFRTTLEKALFSSPAACLETIDARIARLEKGKYEQDIGDEAALNTLRSRIADIGPDQFSRFTALVELMRDKNSELYWTGGDPEDRLVIFTERIATLKFLQKHIPEKLNLRDKQVAILHGGLSDTRQQEVVEDFGREKSPLRLLIASDVASEGINLHYLSHRLIHFDIPWSLMVFQQRNGRIDRYGQQRVPLINYFVTESSNPRINGDQRILELLVRKDEEAVKNIGDPSALAGVYDIDAEEALTAKAMQEGQSVEQFSSFLSGPEKDDGLDMLAFLQEAQESAEDGDGRERKREMPALFPDDLVYLEKGLLQTAAKLNIAWESDPENRILEMELPDDLAYRFRFLPREIKPEKGRLVLTDDKDRMQDEISRCRKDETAWPDLHYLWPLHPAVQWLNDRIQSGFDRHQAPVLTLPTLESGELIYILTGIIPNLKGQPLIQHWFGIFVRDGAFQGIGPIEKVLEKTGLTEKTFANPGDARVDPRARELLPDVVQKARDWMRQKRRDFEDHLNPQLNEKLEDLEKLKIRHLQRIQSYFSGQKVAENIKKSRRQEKKREVEKLFSGYMHWIEESMSTEEHAYIKIAAVIQGTAD